MFVPFCNTDLVIGGNQVDAGKILCATKLVKQITNTWNGEHIQTSHGVESPKNYTHSQLARFLTYKLDGSPIRAY